MLKDQLFKTSGLQFVPAELMLDHVVIANNWEHSSSPFVNSLSLIKVQLAQVEMFFPLVIMIWIIRLGKSQCHGSWVKYFEK